MPEGYEGGYQPTAEELQTAEEHLEKLGIVEEPTEKGIQHVDARGNVVDRTETWQTSNGLEKQAIQYTYLEDGIAAIEDAKYTTEKSEWVVRREHPQLPCVVPVEWDDEDLDTSIPVKAEAILENLGQTISGKDSREPYAQFIVTDPKSLEAFADFRRKPGETFAKKEGKFGDGFSLTINGRDVTFNAINKISVNFTNEWPSRVTLHCYDWEEKPTEKEKAPLQE